MGVGYDYTAYMDYIDLTVWERPLNFNHSLTHTMTSLYSIPASKWLGMTPVGDLVVDVMHLRIMEVSLGLKRHTWSKRCTFCGEKAYENENQLSM